MKHTKSVIAMIMASVICLSSVCTAMAAEESVEGTALNEIAVGTETKDDFSKEEGTTDEESINTDETEIETSEIANTEEENSELDEVESNNDSSYEEYNQSSPELAEEEQQGDELITGGNNSQQENDSDTDDNTTEDSLVDEVSKDALGDALFSECGDNLTWKLTGEDNDLTLTISGTGEMYDFTISYGTAYAPWYRSSNLITSVIVCEGVTSIGMYSFRNMTCIKSVTLPDSVTQIGNFAFVGCKELTDISLPNALTRIGNGAFQDCVKLDNIVLSGGINEIGRAAFERCSSLSSIVLPDSLERINDSTFHMCKKLDTVVISNGITVIDNFSFSGCSSLESVEIPESVEIIGDFVFDNCNSLCSIVIPYGVEKIGSYAFNNCHNLTSLDIPESVREMGESAFSYCDSLVNVNIPNDIETICEGTFYGCSSLQSIIIPDSVNSIGDDAFYNCTSLSHVEMPETMNSIGGLVFENTPWQKSLGDYVIINSMLIRYQGDAQKVSIPSEVKRINNNAFYNCEIVDVTIPSSVLSIGACSFYNCSNLKSISIPASVARIEKSVFGVSNVLHGYLEEIYFYGSFPTIDDYAFSDITANAFYPINDSTWEGDVKKNYGGKLSWIGWNPVTSIISGVYSLTNWDSGNQDVYLDDWPYDLAENASITPADLLNKWVGEYVYAEISGNKIQRLSALEEHIGTLQSYVSSEGEAGSFASEITISGNTYSTLSEDVLFWANYDKYPTGTKVAFYLLDGKIAYIVKLQYKQGRLDTHLLNENSIVINGETLKLSLSFEKPSVSDLAEWEGKIVGFYTGEIPNEYTGQYVIYELIGLVQLCGPSLSWIISDEGALTISGTGEMYDYNRTDNLPPWANCASSIKEIVIEEGVTKISEGAFSGTNIKWIWIPDSVVEIGQYAFYACSSLISVSIGTGVDYLEFKSFADCDSLVAVYFKNEEKIGISRLAFDGCGDIACFYPNGTMENWYLVGTNTSDNFGASSILWDDWGDAFINFNQNEYTCEINETISICATSSSDNIVYLACGFITDNKDSYIISNEDFSHMSWYDMVVGCDVTGTALGSGQITLTCVTGTGYISTVITINVIEADNDEPSSDGVEPFEQYSMDDTYRFHNLSDSILLKPYLKYFQPAQAYLVRDFDDGTGGQCFGMVYSAVTTTRFQYPKVNSYSGAKRLLDVTKNMTSSSTLCSASEFIKYAHLFQYTPESIRKSCETRGKLQSLYEAVVNMNNGGVPVHIGLSDADSAHSLLARGIRKNTKSKTELRVYDCNYELNKNCYITLYKTDGKFTSWEYIRPGYEYKSVDGDRIEYSTDYEDFLDLYNDPLPPDIRFSHLVSTSDSGSSVETSSGDELLLSLSNDSSLDELLPIATRYTGSASDCDNLYWLNVGDTFTINSSSEKSHYEIASKNHTVELTLPGESSADLNVTDETDNKAKLIMPESDDGYSVTFSETDNEGESTTTYSISGTSGTEISVQETENGIIVIGEDLGTLEITTPEATLDITVPEDMTGIVVDENGNTEALKQISAADVTIDNMTNVYTGNEVKPVVTVIYGNTVLTEADHYSVSYENNINVGTAKVIITGNGSYFGTIEKEFKIIPKSVTPIITLSDNSFTYTGKPQKPTLVSVKDGNTALTDSDFDITWPEECINCGAYEVVVTLKGNYTGSGTASFTINKLPQTVTARPWKNELGINLVTCCTVSGIGWITYSSSDPSVVTVDNSGRLTGCAEGTATITVTANGDENHYSGQTAFEITVRSVEAADSGPCGDEAVWTYYNNGTVEINGTGTIESRRDSSGHYLWDEYYTPDYVWEYEKVDTVIIKEGITGIGEEVFSERSSLGYGNMSDSPEIIIIADSVNTIYKRAFINCSKLERVNIGAGLTTLDACAFSYCPSLEEISISEDNNCFTIFDGALYSKDLKYLYKLPNDGRTDFLISKETETIKEDALGDLDHLQILTVPKSVRVIEDFALDGCNNLTDVYYEGSASEWRALTIGNHNNVLENVTFHYAEIDKSVEECIVTLGNTSYVYDASEKKPEVSVENANNTLLIEGTDYTVAYENNVYPGIGRVVITGIGNYIGTKTETFTIEPMDAPVLISVSAGNNGITVKWNAVSGANKYRVFRKTGNNGWKMLAVTTSTSYTDKTAIAGYKYTYTVRCVSDDELTNVSDYSTVGKAITCAAKPTLSSVQNQTTGIKITWKKAKGAVKYRIFKKTGSSGWKKLADTKSLSYLDKSVKSGTKYIYTVRCITSDGKVYTSGFNTTGKIIARAARPTISSISSPKAKQLTVKWKKVTGITGYQVQYSTSKSFASGNKIVTVKGATAVSKTIGSLASKKKYYVRMRTYKTVSGKNYYSAWSAAKNLTVK